MLVCILASSEETKNENCLPADGAEPMKLMDFLLRARDDSLAKASKSKIIGWVLIAASALLGAGLFLPAVEAKFLIFSETRSLLSLIIGLFQGDEFLLASIVLLFSVIMPIGKLLLLYHLYTHPKRAVSRRKLRVLETIGKWSMLDVLVVALAIFSLKSSALGNAFTMPGIYFFAAAALLSHFVSGHIVRALEAQHGHMPT